LEPVSAFKFYSRVERSPSKYTPTDNKHSKEGVVGIT